jgi:hypothetical protein
MGVAFVDTIAHPAAAKFYSWCPQEITGRGSSAPETKRFERVVEVPFMTLMDLLNQMELNCAFGDDVLICCHGTSSGLSIPIVMGTPSSVGATEIASLLSPKGVPPEWSTSGQWERIRDAIGRVWARKLNHVALRACNVGSMIAQAASLRMLFGARRLSALCKLDSYAWVEPAFPPVAAPPGALAKTKMDWRLYHPRFALYPTSDKRTVLIDATPTPGGFTAALWAEDLDTLQQWCKDYLPGAPSYTSGQLYLHGLDIGGRLVFPRQAEYVAQTAVSWFAWDVWLRPAS